MAHSARGSAGEQHRDASYCLPVAQVTEPRPAATAVLPARGPWQGPLLGPRLSSSLLFTVHWAVALDFLTVSESGFVHPFQCPHPRLQSARTPVPSPLSCGLAGKHTFSSMPSTSTSYLLTVFRPLLFSVYARTAWGTGHCTSPTPYPHLYC